VFRRFFHHFIYFSNIISNQNIYFLKLHVTITRSFITSQLIENIKILVSSDRVKDGSGALYDFAQGQNHKSGANSLTRSGEEERRSKRKGPKHTKHLDFQPHNPLKFA
jgi:hypothetical protein